MRGLLLLLLLGVLSVAAGETCDDGHCHGAGDHADAPAKPSEEEVKEMANFNPFAVFRQTHEAIRVAMGDLERLAKELTEDSKSLPPFFRVRDATDALLACVELHMSHEDDGIFPLLDRLFDDAATKEKLALEHAAENAFVPQLQLKLRRYITTPDDEKPDLAVQIRKDVTRFVHEHEKHLKHEEVVMQALTQRAGKTALERGAHVRGIITRLDKDKFPAQIEYVLRKLETRKKTVDAPDAAAAGADAKPKRPTVDVEDIVKYVKGLQYSSTNTEYQEYLKLIKKTVMPDTWHALGKHKLKAGGKQP